MRNASVRKPVIASTGEGAEDHEVFGLRLMRMRYGRCT